MNVNRSQESGEDDQTCATQGYGGISPPSRPEVRLHPHAKFNQYDANTTCLRCA